ncbi:uncharacterized protein LOC141646450 [Silene latifolia]|uniref:uncharacterized protein LOC141646450 n=1 Tax=Silene latifolia TaxID=37657 RepID=UPI003D78AEC7
MVNEEVPSKRKNILLLDYLVDELLVEILCRLPDHKNVVTCKAVCKRWASLVSRPFFITRFVDDKVGKNYCAPYSYINGFSEKMKMKNDGTFGLVVRKSDDRFSAIEIYPNKDIWKGLMIRFNDPIYNPRNVSVSSLPRLSYSLPHNITVVGSCNDLLLYSKDEYCFMYQTMELYIGNVETKQWVELPTLDLKSRARLYGFVIPTLYLPRPAIHIGFVCDPYYSRSHTGNLTIDDAYSACVVVILQTFGNVTEFSGFLLSPHTGGMWRSVVLSLPLSCRPAHMCSYFIIERKYYFRCDECIISFDPFVDGNDVIKCDSLPLPISDMELQLSTFGVFHKRLYMCLSDESEGTYRVWALEDFKTGSWSLQHSIKVQDWIPCNRRLVSLIDRDRHAGKPISFHPTNPDIIYTISPHWIILCNLRTREIEVVSKLPESYQDFFPDIHSFETILPVWPSPLPIL